MAPDKGDHQRTGHRPRRAGLIDALNWAARRCQHPAGDHTRGSTGTAATAAPEQQSGGGERGQDSMGGHIHMDAPRADHVALPNNQGFATLSSRGLYASSPSAVAGSVEADVVRQKEGVIMVHEDASDNHTVSHRHAVDHADVEHRHVADHARVSRKHLTAHEDLYTRQGEEHALLADRHTSEHEKGADERSARKVALTSRHAMEHAWLEARHASQLATMAARHAAERFRIDGQHAIEFIAQERRHTREDRRQPPA
jgi:hypothetical protein